MKTIVLNPKIVEPLPTSIVNKKLKPQTSSSDLKKAYNNSHPHPTPSKKDPNAANNYDILSTFGTKQKMKRYSHHNKISQTLDM